jgi:hypothetical protein
MRRYIHGKDVFEAFYKKDLVRLHVRLCCHRTWGMTDVADIRTECLASVGLRGSSAEQLGSGRLL